MADKDTVEVVLRVSRPLIEDMTQDELARELGGQAASRAKELLAKDGSDG